MDMERYDEDGSTALWWLGQEAADLAGETGARLVIPGHWDMFADNSADPERFADYLDVKYHGKVTCLIPEVMEKIVYGGFS